MKMKTFSYYLVKKEYDEMNKRNTSSVLRTDGPIRVNSFGTVAIDKRFVASQKRVDYYLMYLIEGSLSLCLDGETLEFKAGDFAILPPYYPIKYEKNNDERLVYYLMHFSGTDVERFLYSIGFERLPTKQTVGIVESVIDEFLTLFDHYVRNTPYIQEIVASGLERILIQLSLKSIKTDEVAPPYRAVYYIKQHLTEKISVPMLASLEGLSESRFYTVFKEKIGCSPVEYINTLRIERACNLLSSTPMSVGEIGVNCGFDDNFYFSKIFKKKMGVSPTKYKAGIS